MHESVERYIAKVLRDTGIPIARRREIADEIRSHLAESAAARIRDGVCSGCASRDAIEAFGPARIVRRKLVWQQWRDDVFANRVRLIGPAALGVIGALAFALLDTIVLRASLGIGGAVRVFLVIALCAWTATLVHLRLMRPRPDSEVSTLVLTARFGGAVLAGIMSVVATGVGLAANAFSNRSGITEWSFYSALAKALDEGNYGPVTAIVIAAVLGGVVLARVAASRVSADISDAVGPALE